MQTSLLYDDAWQWAVCFGLPLRLAHTHRSPQHLCMLGGKRPMNSVGTHIGSMTASGFPNRSRQFKQSFTICWVRWTQPARQQSPSQLSMLLHWRVHRSRGGHTFKTASRPFQRTAPLSACSTAWSWPSSWSSNGMTCCCCRWDHMLLPLLAQLCLSFLMLLLVFACVLATSGASP